MPTAADVPGAELRGVYQSFPYAQPPRASIGPAIGGCAGLPVAVAVTPLMGSALRIAIRRGNCRCAVQSASPRRGEPARRRGGIRRDARKEGAQSMFLSPPVAVLGNAAGEVTQVRCIRMETGDPDHTGRRRVKPVAGSEFDVPADVVFVAYGFTVPRLPDSDDFGKLSLDGRGCLQVDANRMTNLPGVFASGSIVRGPAFLSDVVRDALAKPPTPLTTTSKPAGCDPLFLPTRQINTTS